MKLSTFNSQLSTPMGFTLIELLWSVAIAAMLSAVGIAAFFSYSRQQALNSAVSDFTTMLQVAKSRAQTQVKACADSEVLKGYNIIFFESTNKYGYLLNAVCSINTNPIPNQKKEMQKGNGIKFCNYVFDPQNPAFFFSVLTGAASGIKSVDISGYGKAKTVSVSPSGVIKVTDSGQVCST